MERIIGFLPSVAVLLWVVAFTQFCVERARSRVGANLNSIQWVKDNPTKVGLVTLPTIWIVGPILEEILFRLPLLFWFNSVDELSWKWILISGALFGMMHLPTGTAPVSVAKVFRKHDAGKCDSDNLNEEMY
jgi:membrane protease YdiL (CAAX protease family)